MIKLLHTADVHLDSPLKSLTLKDPEVGDVVRTATRTAFMRIIDAALEEDVAALLIAGDLFDGSQHSPRTAAFLNEQFGRLHEAGIRVFYIRGNHDAENRIARSVSLPDNVHVFGARKGQKVELAEGIWIHGVGFAQKTAPESLLPKFAPPVPGAVNIGMLHTSLGGAEGHDVYAPVALSELVNHGFDYWALGHIHKRAAFAENPWVVMPGTPQGRDIGEPGPGSATLITVDDGITVREIPTSAVEFRRLSVAIDGLRDFEAVSDAVRAAFRELADGIDSDVAVARLTLTGNTPLRWPLLRDREILRERVRELAVESGQLLEKLELELSDEAPADNGALGELADLMNEIRHEAWFREESAGLVRAIADALTPHQRAVFLPEEHSLEELAERAAEQGRDLLLARFRGADN